MTTTTRTFRRATLVVLGLFLVSAVSYAQAWSVGISVGFPPPPLPVYVQPPCPGDGYLWTPGYWGYDDEDNDYYWVPGTWLLAPRVGFLWTPGYWAEQEDFYAWRPGYWGPQVGFYGGINYGFGYFGVGFAGGYWHDRDFFYNRAVTNVTNVSITNVYNTTVVNNRYTNSPVSYNGGPEGTQRRPTDAEQAAQRAARIGATDEQRHQEWAARSIPSLRAAANHGLPPIAATPRPAVFTGRGLTAARGFGRTNDAVPFRAPQDQSGGRATHGAAGLRPYAAASSVDRLNGHESHQQGRTPVADRPAWADRGATQVAPGRSATPPVTIVKNADGNRPGPAGRYRPSAHPDSPAISGPWTQAPNRRDLPAPESFGARNATYPTEHAPAPRWTPPLYSAAPARQYAPHEPMRQASAQRMPMPQRDYGRAPSFSPPHPARNPSPAQAINAPRKAANDDRR